MPFTVQDFRDLLRLLEQHPEWRADLRRHVLTEELLGLPGIVRELAEAQQRTEQRLSQVAELLDALAQAQARTEGELGTLARRVGDLADRVGDLAGQALELRNARRAPAYFGRLARRLRVVEPSALAELLEEAVEGGRLTEAEREAVLEADLVLAGQRRDDRADVSYLVELSVGLGLGDVTRAADRATILAKLDRPAVPVVAGGWINPEAGAAARAHGVWQVLDGRATPPTSA